MFSGFICYLLTRYLTAPILRLREASQHLAQGDLSTRATAGMERRRDELGLLVQDFNAMAERIEELVSRQRQLIYDISHELRSPLARLNVALDLARGRKGDDPAFDHMEQDLERLNEMIGRLLTVARLDSSAIPVAMSQVDLTELISQIARSADLELRKNDAAVQLNLQGQLFVQGNSELLHSAIENVVRNAIRYTGIGNPVEVSVTTQNTAETLIRAHCGSRSRPRRSGSGARQHLSAVLSCSRRSQPPIRRNRPGPRHRLPRCPHPRWNHLRAKRPGPWP